MANSVNSPVLANSANLSNDYASKTPRHYLAKLAPSVRESLSPAQLDAFYAVLEEALPKPSPKIVDLRFCIDLILTRFYFVLFIGKDRRRQGRRHNPSALTKIFNLMATIVILLGVNLTISASLLLVGYLVKSIMGVNLLPGHFPDFLKQLFS